MSTPTWFITGCSTGFGRELAFAVLARGWNVVATARDVTTIQDIAEGSPERALLLPLDVTDEVRVTEAIADAVTRFGAVDVLVNNAGYGYRAAIEEGDAGDVAKLFATNVFGPVSLIKAVLPGMRARRSGAVVNLSSAAGVRSAAGSGYYAATKFALEGLSDALRKEVASLGIKVMVVEPGPFRTDFAGRSLQQSLTEIPDYAATAGARRKGKDHSDGNQPGDPARAAELIISILQVAQPPFRLVLGNRALAVIRNELHERLAEISLWEDESRTADFAS